MSIGIRLIQVCYASQVRSHAQKFFLKLEKAGKADVVPPPRPKKRAAKPYAVQSVRTLPRLERDAISFHCTDSGIQRVCTATSRDCDI